jgi:hypothetical protein
VNWDKVVRDLSDLGWCRLQEVVSSPLASALEDAAPGPWRPAPPIEGPARVRQAGEACHSDVDGAAAPVRELAAAICAGVDAAGEPGTSALPPFNHAEWSRPHRGQMLITAHRDPPVAGGVIVVVTLRGQATFRVWDLDGDLLAAQAHPELAREWETLDGDIVLLRGGGWPFPAARCPIHEAQAPVTGERVTLTLRHNKGGFGADYFE